SLAGCEKHNEFAKETLHCLSRSSGKVIIRWLLLPGHLECCGNEIVKMLVPYKDFHISLIDDFIPDYKMQPNRRNTEAEIKKAKEMIRLYSLRDIDNCGKHFWK
ncbi:MAG: hypothetical protein AB1393_14685, partial [Candidatus Edwardsbacteria bacterium]